MERSSVDTRTRDWYSVSVDTLRAWGLVLTLGVMVAVGFFGYRYWERYDLERRATEAVGEARMSSSRLRSLELPEGFHDDHRKASLYLDQATSSLAQSDFGTALDRGRESREIFQSILEATGRGRGVSVAQIFSFDGRVEYRRGESGDWENARPRIPLYSGDHVKTGPSGSANVLFREGGHYVVQPDTQVVIRTRSTGGVPQQAIEMDYGWVNLNTSERGGTVATPEAEARVEGDSAAAVTYDAETRSGTFAAYQGGMEVESTGGDSRRVGALEEVVQSDGKLSEPTPLPPAPRLTDPEDNLDLEAAPGSELVLAWQPVEGAATYALQVSASRLFIDNLIDVENRETTRATLGVRGDGVFHWRVAASGPEGELGPWSEPRRFRIASRGEVPRGEGGGAGDRKPPPLEIDVIDSYGSIFLVKGRTEPGISVVINGEPVRVEANGEFNKTVQFTSAGWNFIEIRARDGRGTEAVVNRRVFVEIL